MAKRIYISPSDQWSNPTPSGHSEAHHCTLIAEALSEILTSMGYETRVGDNSVEGTYIARAGESNDWLADIHIPIHTNAGGGDGCVVFCHSNSLGNPYVKSVYEKLSALTPTQDDGIREYNGLYEIKHTKAPCVYVECEFHDNPTTEAWIDNNIWNIADAIARGIAEVDGVQTPETPENTDIKYLVQVGAYAKKENAENMVRIMKAMGYNAIIKER